MSLKEVFCQDKAIDFLQRAFDADKVAHAYIFAGAEGVGKFKTAAAWGKLLLCEKPVIDKSGRVRFYDSCGLCESCRLFEAGVHPDFNVLHKELREFTRDGKGKLTPVDLPVDVVREFLSEKVSVRPCVSRRKVFIVDESEKLNISSQNSLLKVLEEPPVYCCIILLCTAPESLSATIKSRCQIIRFGPLDEEKILDKLEETGIGQVKAGYFARLSGGSLGTAWAWSQLEASGLNLYDIKKELLDTVVCLSYAESLDIAQWLLDERKKIATAWGKLEAGVSKTDINRRAAKILIELVISSLYDAMGLTVRPERSLINFDQRQQIKELAERLGPEGAAEKIADTCMMMLWIDSAVNERLVFEQLLLNLAVSDKMGV
jgi:DNA polymerase-3 subunit delta'